MLSRFCWTWAGADVGHSVKLNFLLIWWDIVTSIWSTTHWNQRQKFVRKTNEWSLHIFRWHRLLKIVMFIKQFLQLLAWTKFWISSWMSTKSKLELRLYTCQISSILMKCMPEFSFICLLKKRTFYGLLLTFELAMQRNLPQWQTSFRKFGQSCKPIFWCAQSIRYDAASRS